MSKTKVKAKDHLDLILSELKELSKQNDQGVSGLELAKAIALKHPELESVVTSLALGTLLHSLVRGGKEGLQRLRRENRRTGATFTYLYL